MTAVRDAGERVDADQVLEPAVRRFQRETQPRQLFVARFERMRALDEATLQIPVHAFELGLDLTASRQLALQLARAAPDPRMQEQHAREHAADRGEQEQVIASSEPDIFGAGAAASKHTLPRAQGVT